MWYFLALLVFYLGFTRISEVLLERLMQRLTRYCNLMSGNLSEVCALSRFTGGHAPQ
jgi:polar amino acid transport system permease protein